MEPNAYYWRDSNGLELDLVTEENQQLKLYEIKSSDTHSGYISWLDL